MKQQLYDIIKGANLTQKRGGAPYYLQKLLYYDRHNSIAIRDIIIMCGKVIILQKTRNILFIKERGQNSP